MIDKQRVTCPECGGKGVIDGGGQQGSASGPNWVNCPKCNGEKTVVKEGE